MSRAVRLALVCAAFMGGNWARADGKFKDLPNAQRVEELAKVLPEIGRGGKINKLTWTPSSLTFQRGDSWHSVDLATGVITSSSKPDGPEPEVDKSKWPRDPSAGRAKQRTQATSPDGSTRAIHRDGGVYLENIQAKTQSPVIEMKELEGIRYGTADWVYGEELDQGDAMWWSDDGKFLAFYAFDDSQVPKYEILRGWDQLRTSKATLRYPKAGDPNAVAGLMVYEVATGRLVAIDVGDDRGQYIYGVRWSPRNELLYFRTNRRQNSLDWMAASPTTGASRVVVNETQDTWQDNRPSFRILSDGDRFVWTSERSGFNNLQLRKLSDSSFVRELTHLAAPVVDILHIDEALGQVWFRVNSGDTPRFSQIHRVNLDGTREQWLTDGAHHWSNLQVSPDGAFFTAMAETPTTPPRTVLLANDSNNSAREVATLASAPVDGFEKHGLHPPELFTFTAADGVTELWGELFFPPNFDPAKKYPLLIDVYGGPGVLSISGRFDAGSPDRGLGLLIAKLDNRGTPQRGKAFESATYLRLCSADLDDQVAGVKALSTRPYVDANRVAMKGHSYGGTMSAMAVLRYPEVFCAAVAGAPVTDWRNYDTIYTERYMRTPGENGEGYDASSAVKLAPGLKSNLLLIHGLVDDNVHPSNTLQMAKAMQDAEVPFEMMLFPDSDHGIHSPSYKAKAWWFLAEHLGLLEQSDSASEATAGEATAGEATAGEATAGEATAGDPQKSIPANGTLAPGATP